jgi:hypothetical protein
VRRTQKAAADSASISLTCTVQFLRKCRRRCPSKSLAQGGSPCSQTFSCFQVNFNSTDEQLHSLAYQFTTGTTIPQYLLPPLAMLQQFVFPVAATMSLQRAVKIGVRRLVGRRSNDPTCDKPPPSSSLSAPLDIGISTCTVPLDSLYRH